ncbi:metallophosphoesterase [Luteolibacter marinus]|uniref:metallophosphoesterase n=1 Tax=Luteolibacter marinus TaxID=2776705 RepID=UPI001867B711|nr:metallophosphoesterase [Luteolibacter marinus]
MIPTPVRSGRVVSDLHLFSRRSDGEALFRSLEPQLAPDETLVLNGDTFDFRWSTLQDEASTIDAAVRWLAGVLERGPRREIHFLLGNHDCHAGFRRRLEDLGGRHPRLHCHEFRLQLGNCLFLHGDCTNRRMDHDRLARFRDAWSRDRQRGQVAAAAYGAIDAIGLSRRFHDWYFPERTTVRRLAHHLDLTDPGWDQRVSHCFFGHTHRPFESAVFRGVNFSNTGSAIRGMGFLPLAFRWVPDTATVP